MGVSWTTEQQQVIDLRNRNILVSAAAGSGKTAVLVQRIITMLTDREHPMDVDQLLVVTFTEAAAAEMKERVRTAIEKELLEHPDDAHLLRQSTLIHNAQITTIHSFCLSVIRDHFHAIDLDPGFRIAEEGELKLLKQDVLEELLEDRYEEGTDRFLDFSLGYGAGKTDKAMEEIILKIYDYSRSYPDAKDWLDGCYDLYQIDSEEELEQSPMMVNLKTQVRKLLEDALGMNESGILMSEESDGPYMYLDNLNEDRDMMESLLTKESYRDLQLAFQAVSFGRLKVKKDLSVNDGKKEAVKGIRNRCKKLMENIRDKYLSDRVEDIIADLALCRDPLAELLSLVEEFAERFEARKREQNMIDFSDMEQYAMRILAVKDEDGKFVPSPAAREYQDHYKEIMIDEYQDSNLIQETILTSISGVSKGIYNIFMVGDVKQSIYRFRLSRPELFMEKYHTYSLTESKTQRIDLHKNFRSRAEVLDSVNEICKKIMIRDLGGIQYDEKVALYPGAAYEPGEHLETEFLLMDLKTAGDYDLTKEELEAHMIAGRIRELLKNYQVQDKKTGEMRPVRYSDIVILCRSLTTMGPVLSEVLGKEGIPVFVGTQSGYFGTYEIGVILDYLQVLNNRRQDIPLAAVLTSPFGLLTESDLAKIKICGGKLPFWKAVQGILDGTLVLAEADIVTKLQKVFDHLNRFRERVPYTPMHELLQDIYAETGFMDYVAAMPGGIQRSANLKMLLEKARSFESTSYKGLFHFIRYIDQLKKYDVDYGEANVEDEQSDTVRVMTFHKSKGLEFPVVFVSNMGKQFNTMDAKKKVVLHSGYGIGLYSVDLKERTKRDTFVKKMIQREEELDTRGEELRILYVALTRAKEKLILTGTISDAEKKLPEVTYMLPNADGTLPYSVLSGAASYMEWVLPSVWDGKRPDLFERQVLTPEDVLTDSIQEVVKEEVTKEMLLSWESGEKGESLFDSQFHYEYPYTETKRQKLKFTVSELKKLSQVENQESEDGETSLTPGKEQKRELGEIIPAFRKQEEVLTGASRGTAYHRFLELFDYKQEFTSFGEEEIRLLKEKYVSEGKMTKDMADCISPSDILKFLKTDAAGRMHRAALLGKLYKEQPFVMGVSADTIYQNADADELILVQGIIDVFFVEEGELVLLDYKTDNVRNPEVLVEKYSAQLEYYGKALEGLYHRKIREKIIYSVKFGREIEIIHKN